MPRISGKPDNQWPAGARPYGSSGTSGGWTPEPFESKVTGFAAAPKVYGAPLVGGSALAEELAAPGTEAVGRALNVQRAFSLAGKMMGTRLARDAAGLTRPLLQRSPAMNVQSPVATPRFAAGVAASAGDSRTETQAADLAARPNAARGRKGRTAAREDVIPTLRSY